MFFCAITSSTDALTASATAQGGILQWLSNGIQFFGRALEAVWDCIVGLWEFVPYCAPFIMGFIGLGAFIMLSNVWLKII